MQRRYPSRISLSAGRRKESQKKQGRKTPLLRAFRGLPEGFYSVQDENKERRRWSLIYPREVKKRGEDRRIDAKGR